MTRLRKFFLIPLPEQRLLLKAVFLLVIMRLGLWLLPFPSLMKLVARLSRTRIMALQAAPDLLEKVGWAVRAASRYVPKATCLTQALAAQTMLTSQGFPADLRIGVAKDPDGQFQAHAWIEHGGRVIIGGYELSSYVTFKPL